MLANFVLEPNAVGCPSSCLRRGLVGLQLDSLIFNHSPEPFSDYIIAPISLAIHAALDLVGFQQLSELLAFEPTTLIGIHDLRNALILNELVDGT